MTADAITLEDAGAAHAKVLAALYRRCFDETWEAGSLAALLTTPGTFALIAVDAGGEPAGFFLGRSAADECEILSIGVDPARRRAGLGTLLLNRALERAGVAGVRRVVLEVAVDNAAALALYAGAGFRPVGHRAAYYSRFDGGAVDARILAWTLSEG